MLIVAVIADGRVALNVVVSATELPSVTMGVPFTVERTSGNVYTSAVGMTVETVLFFTVNANVRSIADAAVYEKVTLRVPRVAPVKLNETPLTVSANSERDVPAGIGSILVKLNVSCAAELTISLYGAGASEVTPVIAVG
jgi:hypothetical protein